MEQVKKKKNKRRLKNELTGTLFTSFPIIGLLIFTIIPLGMAVVMSFMNMPGMNFEGAEFYSFNDILHNYKVVFSDAYFYKALKNNFILFLELPISIILSIIIAELLSKKVKFTKAFKVILFIPYVCSVAATTFMWNWLLDANYGLVNKVFGLDIAWFADQKYFIWAIMIMGLWSVSGYRILLFTAAITNVNNSLKEAARIDGANPLQVFFHVTIPSITPTIFYAGGEKCMTIVFYIFNKAFRGSPQMGVACAASMILALFIFLLTRLNFWLSKKWVNYDVE